MPTVKLGQTALPPDVVKMDKKMALRVGPCAMGEKALYIGSKFLARFYYIDYRDISRVFKRIAMSKGGYTGKGIFGTMAYFMVLMKDGSLKKCNFKREEDLDLLLEQINKEHPDIPIHSAEAERKLIEAEEKEKASYLKELSPDAEEAIKQLRDAQKLLKIKPGLYEKLSQTAKRRRVSDITNPAYIGVAIAILILATVLAVFGIILWVTSGGRAIIIVLLGLAFIFLVISSRVLPTGRNNRVAIQAEWEDAVDSMGVFLHNEPDFPLPAHYAHPVVLERMIRVIRQGKAETIEQSFEVVKDELKILNRDVEVSQKEYDEVTAVKPMFLIMDYQ